MLRHPGGDRDPRFLAQHILGQRRQTGNALAHILLNVT